MSEPSDSKALHDLNNHLAIIVGFCEVLLDGMPEGDERRDDVVEILNAARKAMEIARDAWGSAR